jgi:ABC-type nickel/cobalt efflux system permease component RcnA
MNKKLNTAVFLVVATAVNIGIMLVVFVGLMVAVTLIARENQQLMSVLYIVAFFLSIVATFLLYSLVMKLFQKKVDMEKYFHPIFRPRGGTPRSPRD